MAAKTGLGDALLDSGLEQYQPESKKSPTTNGAREYPLTEIVTLVTALLSCLALLFCLVLLLCLAYSATSLIACSLHIGQDPK